MFHSLSHTCNIILNNIIMISSTDLDSHLVAGVCSMRQGELLSYKIIVGTLVERWVYWCGSECEISVVCYSERRAYNTKERILFSYVNMTLYYGFIYIYNVTWNLSPDCWTFDLPYCPPGTPFPHGLRISLLFVVIKSITAGPPLTPVVVLVCIRFHWPGLASWLVHLTTAYCSHKPNYDVVSSSPQSIILVIYHKCYGLKPSATPYSFYLCSF